LTKNIYHAGVEPTAEMSLKTTRHRALLAYGVIMYGHENKWLFVIVSNALANSALSLVLLDRAAHSRLLVCCKSWQGRPEVGLAQAWC
jgi:hypothetical protein